MKSAFFATMWVVLTAVVLIASMPSRADDKPPCSGDDTACNLLQIAQKGTDPASGAHVVISYHMKGEPRPKSINLQLYLAKSKSLCSGNVSMTVANVNEGSSGLRSIDGYLCKLRATLARQ